jgi:hypothetical protein
LFKSFFNGYHNLVCLERVVASMCVAENLLRKAAFEQRH